MNILLKENERIDDLNRNGYFIIQNYKKFCFGIDAVLLSDFAKAKKNDLVLDIGTGTGIIPILMSAKTNAKKFFAIDIQKESVDMAKRSVILNNLQEKIEVFHLDIKNVFEKFKENSMNVVITNPPYIKNGSGILNTYDAKTIARHEIFCNLNDIVKATALLLKTNGKFYMVHRPNRLCDIIYTLKKYNLEPKTIRFVQPYENKKPNMVLVESIKNANAFLEVLPNLIVYNNNRKYTEEINKIYYN